MSLERTVKGLQNTGLEKSFSVESSLNYSIGSWKIKSLRTVTAIEILKTLSVPFYYIELRFCGGWSTGAGE